MIQRQSNLLRILFPVFPGKRMCSICVFDAEFFLHSSNVSLTYDLRPLDRIFQIFRIAAIFLTYDLLTLPSSSFVN